MENHKVVEASVNEDPNGDVILVENNEVAEVDGGGDIVPEEPPHQLQEQRDHSEAAHEPVEVRDGTPQQQAVGAASNDPVVPAQPALVPEEQPGHSRQIIVDVENRLNGIMRDDRERISLLCDYLATHPAIHAFLLSGRCNYTYLGTKINSAKLSRLFGGCVCYASRVSAPNTCNCQTSNSKCPSDNKSCHFNDGVRKKWRDRFANSLKSGVNHYYVALIDLYVYTHPEHVTCVFGYPIPVTIFDPKAVSFICSYIYQMGLGMHASTISWHIEHTIEVAYSNEMFTFLSNMQGSVRSTSNFDRSVSAYCGTEVTYLEFCHGIDVVRHPRVGLDPANRRSVWSSEGSRKLWVERYAAVLPTIYQQPARDRDSVCDLDHDHLATVWYPELPANGPRFVVELARRRKDQAPQPAAAPTDRPTQRENQMSITSVQATSTQAAMSTPAYAQSALLTLPSTSTSNNNLSLMPSMQTIDALGLLQAYSPMVTEPILNEQPFVIPPQPQNTMQRSAFTETLVPSYASVPVQAHSSPKQVTSVSVAEESLNSTSLSDINSVRTEQNKPQSNLGITQQSTSSSSHHNQTTSVPVPPGFGSIHQLARYIEEINKWKKNCGIPATLGIEEDMRKEVNRLLYQHLLDDAANLSDGDVTRRVEAAADLVQRVVHAVIRSRGDKADSMTDGGDTPNLSTEMAYRNPLSIEVLSDTTGSPLSQPPSCSDVVSNVETPTGLSLGEAMLNMNVDQDGANNSGKILLLLVPNNVNINASEEQVAGDGFPQIHLQPSHDDQQTMSPQAPRTPDVDEQRLNSPRSSTPGKSVLSPASDKISDIDGVDNVPMSPTELYQPGAQTSGVPQGNEKEAELTEDTLGAVGPERLVMPSTSNQPLMSQLIVPDEESRCRTDGTDEPHDRVDLPTTSDRSLMPQIIGAEEESNCSTKSTDDLQGSLISNATEGNGGKTAKSDKKNQCLARVREVASKKGMKRKRNPKK